MNLDYIPYTQHPWGFGDFEVRYSGSFAPVAAAVQQTIHSIDRNLPITHVTTLDAQLARSITNQRLVARLSAFFGLLAVFLSCIGIYGVMSYVVTRRTSEIGIRMALGAGRPNMLWMVLRETLILVSVGVVIGVPVTLAGDRLVSNMLFGLGPTDLVTLVGATAILLMVAAIAGYLPGLPWSTPWWFCVMSSASNENDSPDPLIHNGGRCFVWSPPRAIGGSRAIRKSTVDIRP